MLKNLILLSGFSTFVVIVIVGLGIYHDYNKSSLMSNTQVHVIAITPGFDKKTLTSLRKRIPVAVNLQEKSSVVSEDSKKTASLTPSITPAVNLSKISTNSGAITPLLKSPVQP